MPLAGAVIGEVEEAVEKIKRGYVQERNRDAGASVWNVRAGLSVPRKRVGPADRRAIYQHWIPMKYGEGDEVDGRGLAERQRGRESRDKARSPGGPRPTTFDVRIGSVRIQVGFAVCLFS